MIGARNKESLRLIRALLASYGRPDSAQFEISEGGKGPAGSLIAQAQLSSATVRSWITMVIVGGAVILCIAGVSCGALFVGIGVIVIWFRVSRRAHANRRALDRDLPALLTSVASSVRAGIDPLSALLAAREYLQNDSPLVHEVEKIRSGLGDGAEEETLLESFMTTYASQEGELFKRCLILSRRHGCSLAEPLHRITKVVRQRQSFRRKIKAALAMHRMSAVGIALCAGAMGALQIGTNPAAVEIAMRHPMGGKLLIAGITLILIGLTWMMLMGREAGSR